MQFSSVHDVGFHLVYENDVRDSEVTPVNLCSFCCYVITHLVEGIYVANFRVNLGD